MSLLTGTSTAANRDELEQAAVAIAAQYYGTKCVAVSLGDASSNSDEASTVQGTTVSIRNSFTADWQATEVHKFQRGAYGPAKCAMCQIESWPKQ